MRVQKFAGIGLVVVILGALGFFALGGYNIAADEPHWTITTSMLTIARKNSIAIRAKSIEVPKDLETAERISNGAVLYDEMCANCHLAPGIETTELRQGLYPQPPTLTNLDTWDPQVFYYTIAHGIKMTAMPAWGKTHSAQKIWDMVAFLHKLPRLTPEQYRAMTADTNPQHDHGHSRCGAD
ncbi:MAG: cytochrome c [Gammaproteobacteria bacterium]|nr:cytochrome c [Gammaproteobacteria bacterium]